MPSLYELSAEAQDDIFEIWSRIASEALKQPIASRRRDLTKRPVLFFSLYSFVVVYQPDVRPIRIMAVLRGKRDVKRVLAQRP